MGLCYQCGNLTKNSLNSYCSNKCQADYKHEAYIASWKQGDVSGSRGVKTRNISGHVKRYLHKKFNNSCSICNWGGTNLTTGKVPLEVDHIDGNSENNREENLRLLCPNCHPKLPFFNSKLPKFKQRQREVMEKTTVC